MARTHKSEFPSTDGLSNQSRCRAAGWAALTRHAATGQAANSPASSKPRSPSATSERAGTGTRNAPGVIAKQEDIENDGTDRKRKDGTVTDGYRCSWSRSAIYLQSRIAPLQPSRQSPVSAFADGLFTQASSRPSLRLE